MVYTVTLNPALDYVIKLGELQSKDINRTEGEELFCGGKGINVSVILSELGIENEALGFLAGFSGKQIENMLSSEGIKNDFLYLDSGYTRINVKIKANEEYDINARGAEIRSEDMERLVAQLDEKLNDGDILVLAGSIPATLSDDVYEKILSRYSDKNIKFVVDATEDLLVNVLKYKPFLIKPNHIELGDIFGAQITTLDDIVKYGKEIQKMGAKNVLVSRAKDGAVLIDENGNVITMGNVPGKIKSSVGCGDSMVAGFIAGYIQKNDYHYALKLGSACGNATAFSYSLATKEEIENMLTNEFLK